MKDARIRLIKATKGLKQPREMRISLEDRRLLVSVSSGRKDTEQAESSGARLLAGGASSPSSTSPSPARLPSSVSSLAGPLRRENEESRIIAMSRTTDRCHLRKRVSLPNGRRGRLAKMMSSLAWFLAFALMSPGGRALDPYGSTGREALRARNHAWRFGAPPSVYLSPIRVLTLDLACRTRSCMLGIATLL